MGSFDYTCAISGLPISGGTAVRYLLLTQNPYHRGTKAGSFVCYSTDHWFPRVFPIRAKYNDYGAAEDLQGKAQQAVWLRGFQKDLAECGWGPNTVRDKAMSKTMSLDELLDGIHMGRLHVRDRGYADSVNAERKKAKIPKWIPTRKRVEKLIAKLGLKNYDGSWGSDAFIVTRVDYITVKVRDTMRDGTVGGGVDRLKTIRDSLKDVYAGMVTCGTGPSYSEHAELLLRPLPGIEPRGYSRIGIPKKEPARIAAVASAMIREDVWQAIVALPFVGWDGTNYPVDDARKKIKDTFSERVASLVDERKFDLAADVIDGVDVEKIRELLRRGREILSGDGIVRNAVPFSVGLEESWAWMIEACAGADDSVGASEVEDFCNTVAEFQHISSWLSTVRFLWHPAGGGPQNGEHKEHVEFLRAIEGVAKENAKRQKREFDEDEAEYSAKRDGATSDGVT